MKKGDLVWLTIPRKYVICEKKKVKGYWLCTLEPTIGTVKVYEDQLQGGEVMENKVNLTKCEICGKDCKTTPALIVHVHKFHPVKTWNSLEVK